MATGFQKQTFYTHTQSTAAVTWSIAHNLNTSAPIVDVYIEVTTEGNTTTEKAFPKDIRAIDANNAEVEFTTAKKGFARLS